MARKQSQFLVNQKIAVAILAVVAVIAAGYLSWLLVEDAPLGEFIEGEHYFLVEKPRRIRSEKIEVMEFFSYACVHCYNFDPGLTSWVQEHEGSVEFIRIPVVSSDYWRILGRNYYAMEELGIADEFHMPFFREIHEARKTLNTTEKLADYFAEAGIDREEVASELKSPAVTSQIARADQMARRLKVSSVPTVIIQGKYLIRTSSTIGPKRMLDVMTHLVNLETAKSAGAVPD